VKSYHIARPIGLLFLYSATLLFSLWASYLLRFDFHPGAEYLRRFDLIAAFLIGFKLMMLVAYGQFGSLLSYFSLPDIRKIFLAMLTAAVVLLAVWFWQGIAFAPPRAVILTDFIVSFVSICGLRTGFRLLREGYFEKGIVSIAPRRRIGIIGAGDVGAELVKELTYRRTGGFEPTVFFDDDRGKWYTQIHGVQVIGAPEDIPAFIRKEPLDEVVIAMPGASAKRIREVVRILTECGIKFETVPSYAQLVTGKVRVSQIRPVEIEDLLGRDPVKLVTGSIRELVEGKVVMVTGAGGSIGSELCRQLANYGASVLLLIERSEMQLFLIEQDLKSLGVVAVIVPIVVDIRDERRISEIMRSYRPALLFHAAAHKHVPLMEHQPFEAFQNNTMGTIGLAELAIENGVEQFVFISTDKAINPTSVMGATKRLAEVFLQALQRDGSEYTKFIAVRFGNVLGSSGSVIPTFKRQIASGGPVTVTHPNMTRYFMTAQEAVGLVLQSAALGRGGEIFVLDMGNPVKIVDLARQLIELSGLKPDLDVEIEFTGLRPGEKLFEELNLDTEHLVPTEHAKIMQFLTVASPLAQVRASLLDIHLRTASMEPSMVKAEIQKLVPEYRPFTPLTATAGGQPL